MEYYQFALKHIKGGIKRIILPKENAKEAAIVDTLEVIGASNLKQVIDYLNGKIAIKPTKTDTYKLLNQERNSLVDFSEVRGQKLTKRALEIAAAGRT